MFEDSSLAEDLWTFIVGETVGSHQFSVKDIVIIKGFSEINKDNSENCFGDEDKCDTDLAHTPQPLCTECSGDYSRIGEGEWECMENSQSSESRLYDSRGSTLYPDLKLGCPQGYYRDESGGTCVACGTASCASCNNSDRTKCTGCDMDNSLLLSNSQCESSTCSSPSYY